VNVGVTVVVAVAVAVWVAVGVDVNVAVGVAVGADVDVDVGVDVAVAVGVGVATVREICTVASTTALADTLIEPTAHCIAMPMSTVVVDTVLVRLPENPSAPTKM
jgi:hypothetical protein